MFASGKVSQLYFGLLIRKTSDDSPRYVTIPTKFGGTYIIIRILMRTYTSKLDVKYVKYTHNILCTLVF